MSLTNQKGGSETSEQFCQYLSLRQNKFNLTLHAHTHNLTYIRLNYVTIFIKRLRHRKYKTCRKLPQLTSRKANKSPLSAYTQTPCSPTITVPLRARYHPIDSPPPPFCSRWQKKRHTRISRWPHTLSSLETRAIIVAPRAWVHRRTLVIAPRTRAGKENTGTRSGTAEKRANI